MSILLGFLILLLFLSGTAHAKGGGSKTVDAVGPKSDELQALEKRFYGITDTILNRYGEGGSYTAPPASDTATPVSAGKRTNKNGSVVIPWKRPADVLDSARAAVSGGKGGTTPAVSTATPAVSAGKGGKSGLESLLDTADAKARTANQRYDTLMRAMPGYTQQAENLLGQAGTAGDEWYSKAGDAFGKADAQGDLWYDKAMGAYDRANDFIDNGERLIELSAGTNDWYDQYARNMLGRSEELLTTGQVPKAIMDAIENTVRGGLDRSMGSQLNDLAKRGVINSSVTNRGIADMSREAGDALQRGYLDTFNSVLNGYNSSAGTAADAGSKFVQNYLNIGAGANEAAQTAIQLGQGYGNTGTQRMEGLLNLGNSYAGTGSQKVSDLLKTASGWGGLMDQNMAERQQLMTDIPGYYENAWAPLTPAYDMFKTMLADHASSDKKDTIVKQGK